MGKKPRTCSGIIPLKVSEPNSIAIEWQIANGNCKQPQCPDCYMDWQFRSTENSFKHLISLKLTKNHRIGHFTISPPPDTQVTTKKQVEKLRQKARRILKQQGVKGGLEIYHAYRIQKPIKELIETLATQYYPEDNTDIKTWRTLIKLCQEQGLNWKEYVYLSPHFHYIALFNWTQKATKRQDNWIFKKIGKDRNPESTIKTIMYLLSHITVLKEGSTKNLRYFGNASTRNWSIKKAPYRTQQYVNQLAEKLLTRRKKQEDYGLDSNGNVFIPIEEARNRIKEYDPDERILILKAYNWRETGVPPPKKYYNKIMV